MRLLVLTAFIEQHLAEPRPARETVKRWPGAQKIGGRWYIDLDAWAFNAEAQALYETLVKDPAVAALIGEVP